MKDPIIKHQGATDRARNDSTASPEITGAGAIAEHMQLLADRPDLLPVVPDLCELTGLSAQTLRALINAGKLPGCRIGRKLFVPKSSFLHYVLSGGGM